MFAKSTGRITAARLVALALIASLALALAYIRFAPDGATVSVPSGAKAGDLALAPCTYTAEDGDYDADCGTLVVPENRADPGSRLIALPVTRLHADANDPAEPVFPLWGGPGITNMDWPQASRFIANHDVVLVGYRGIDGSVRLDCPEVASVLSRSTDLLGEEHFRAYGDAFGDCARRLTGEGVDLAGYGLVPQVDDLEAARVALGYDRVNLLSESAGTRTALIYAWRYPESIHRSVMVGVNPPGAFLWDPLMYDEQIGRYAVLCSEDSSCRARTEDLAASMRRTAANMPDRWLFLPINASNVWVYSFFGLMESTPQQAPLSAPSTLDSWLSTAEGDASGFWFQSLFADLFPIPFVWGHYASAARLDAHVAREYFSPDAREGGWSLGHVGTAFAWGGGAMADGWPATPDEDAYGRVQTSEVETLLIGGELDTSTPPQVATDELLPSLPNGHQVVLPAFGHTASFWADQQEAGTRLITSFFDSGRVDDSVYESQRVDFAPALTFPALGKGVLVVMVGVALLAVLSLPWMARRVRTRGRFGPTASAILRSLYPLVLGVGGWFLGILIVTTAMPGIPLDAQLLAVISVAVPVGLAIYWAWLDRSCSAATKAIGLAAAGAGAFAGAWLGFHATTGLVAPITAIAGAVAGANLTLIILDIAQPTPPGGQLSTETTADDSRPDREPAAPAEASRP